ncbi:MAG: tRNA (adenosine(37)-N6)-threonylcarbamoyltransferase complex dimerization subunit type 1 TsaB [Bifidobacteriaceae bacterium]|jgi:tRNA threonylcarbamoyl adenosine modification protein YeaZ|nr:tRNA (adenosine(37)-N6)-threonylcarbamoyltransferase complex dimerization subunit type 1 TsaB [Bifidobacteriaceae bacterium]
MGTCVLTIDTSFGFAVGLVADEKILAFESVSDSMQHVEQLSPAINRVLQMANIDFEDLGIIAVNQGPAPYTGLRVGLAAAKAMSLVLRIPAVGVSCLQVERLLASRQFLESDILVVEDARRKQVYYSYNSDLSDLDYPDAIVAKVIGRSLNKPKGLKVSLKQSSAPSEGLSQISAIQHTVFRENSQPTQTREFDVMQLSSSGVANPKSSTNSRLSVNSKFQRDLVIVGSGVAKYQSVWRKLQASYYLNSKLAEPDSVLIYANLAQFKIQSNNHLEIDLQPLYLRRPDVQSK